MAPLKRLGASALFLSTTPPSPAPLKLNSGTETSKDRKNSEEGLSVASIGSKSSTLYLTSDVLSKAVQPHKLSIVAVETGCHELMKLKVVALFKGDDPKAGGISIGIHVLRGIVLVEQLQLNLKRTKQTLRRG